MTPDLVETVFSLKNENDTEESVELGKISQASCTKPLSNPSMDTMDAVNPSWNVVTIGRGSFASVCILTGRPVAFKQVLFPERALELKAEFEAICKLYDLCNSDSFFAIPRPLACFDPLLPNSYISPIVSPSRQGRARPLVSHGDFKALGLPNAAYAMTQVLPLPLSTAQLIRTLFYPPGQKEATLPTLCRLCFGRVLDVPTTNGRPTRFFNSANFPLDAARYLRLVETGNAEIYNKIEDIAYGMGEMLGRLHWFGGYDGRDIEFVMGGFSFSGVSMNLIDFNQVCCCCFKHG